MRRADISKFLIYQESTKKDKYWANYADENVLLLTHPRVQPYVDLTEPVMQYVSTAAPSLADKRTPFTDFLQGSGRTRVIDSDWVKWKLKGTGEVKARSRENLQPGVATPGINHTEFSLTLDAEWYVEGDILAPDVAKEIQVIVESDPVGDSAGSYIYTVKLVNRDPRAFFPPELLDSNLNWIKIGAAYGEASSNYGSTQFSGGSFLEFQSDLTDYGKSVQVSNKAHNLNLKAVVADEQGRPMKDYPAQIISYIEAEFLAQAKWEKELQLYYGRSAGRNLIDNSSGHERRIGPGLLEFLEDGNVIKYSIEGGSLDMFEDYLQQIWFDRVPPSQRNIVAYTGQGGLKLWRDWLAEKYNIEPTMRMHSDFTRSAKSYDPANYDGYKINTAQPTEASFFPFGSFRVEHWPHLDSTYLNGAVLHPETGLPMSSYEFIILDYGLGNGGGSNIEMLKRQDSEVFTYQCGTWSPVGPLNGRTGRGGFVSSGPERSYTLYHTDTLGVRVKDVTLTAHFVPTVKY